MHNQLNLKHLTSLKFRDIPEKQNECLQKLGAPHVDSFNYIIDEGLSNAVKKLIPIEVEYKGKKISFTIEEACILPPTVPPTAFGVSKLEIWPTECRQRAYTYSGKIIVKIAWTYEGVKQDPIERDLGNIPIMIKSKVCNLSGLTPSQLVEHNEHANEWGGYFISKGHERIIRMLLTSRRNFPIAMKRSTWKGRGSNYSEYGVLIKCVDNDQASRVNILHFINDGTATLSVTVKNMVFFIPIMLIIKCLVNISDEAIYKAVMEGFEDDVYFKRNVMNMLRELHRDNVHSHSDSRRYIGTSFRVKVQNQMSSDATDEQICDFILKNCICIHLDNYEDKFRCIIIMIQKLYMFIQGKCKEEGSDCIMMQEVVLGGHLYLQVLKDKLQSWLYIVKLNIQKKDKGLLTAEAFANILKKSGGVEAGMENFISTGNVSTPASIIAQTSGLTILAENINRMRYMAHFKSVHRGSYFLDSRTTETRKLLPDAWGFICPVHTPDGNPCGLLNHFTKNCEITNVPDNKMLLKLPEILASLGMEPVNCAGALERKLSYVTILDGRVIGRIPKSNAVKLCNNLRLLKINGKEVPKTLEIVLIEESKQTGQFPGVFLFSGPARMMRPVINLTVHKVELIGTFEQVYMDICVTPEEAYPKLTTHCELSKTDFLSNLACLIPMPDYNQSPRNMYQCQMGKQTMGTPCHNWHVQAETKLFRLQTPATPLFKPSHYDSVSLDDFAMGTNAVVAVISYTGYDMEDAMIINKASLERGFAYCSVIKSEFVELKNDNSYFGLDPSQPALTKTLGEDGLPFPGAILTNSSPLYCMYDATKSAFQVGKYLNKEDAVVDNVKLCGSLTGKKDLSKACITLRIQRMPTVGDKFASRAGQKGIFSQRWSAEDLPFTESGLVPDIIFNPHGFPSRMTIAMMIECMAGKSASVHGLIHDASPFLFSEKDTAIDYYGRLLEAGGYSYYGTERMYSGINGCEMTADIFFGVIYYQRLRHMVSDKWQVRSTGPTDSLTHQPIKGRKRGGGVRFGEMERDSLISHGASFLLQDRLFHCSDKSTFMVCKRCGSLLSPSFLVNTPNRSRGKPATCLTCSKSDSIETVEMPYVFKYLAAQLASVNINIKLQLEAF